MKNALWLRYIRVRILHILKGIGFPFFNIRSINVVRHYDMQFPEYFFY
jgi:hypothetical protein